MDNDVSFRGVFVRISSKTTLKRSQNPNLFLNNKDEYAPKN